MISDAQARTWIRLPFIASFTFLSLFYFFNAAANAADIAGSPESEIEAAADDLEYIKSEKKLVGNGNVAITYGDVELTADHVEINVDTKESIARGHVVVRQGAIEALSGDELFYDFDDHKGRFPNGRFFQLLWYGYGKELEQVSKKIFKAKDVYITTCDLPHPHYDIKAKTATIYANDKIIARNVTFRILEVPVFWWPYLIIPLNQDEIISISPGYSDDLGAYLLLTKGIAINENIKGRLHLDWYSKRGFGAGADLFYKFKYAGMGEVKIYGINDNRAPTEGEDNPFQSRSDKNRGRVSWKHRMTLDRYTTLQLQWHEISDEQFLQDFFEREHREEIDPQSFLTITRNSELYSLLAHVEKRTNRFQTVGEKLPEVVFTWLKQPLFGTNFYYTNEEGFVNFDQKNRFAPDGANTVQFYTDQELSYPLRLFRYYNFIPYVDFREDYYTESVSEERGLDRFAAGGGFDSSTRFYRAWDVNKKFMGIEMNRLRHVLEPIVQYRSTKIATVHPSKIVNTTHGDNIDHEDILTFGVENRIQTKRKVGEASFQRVDIVSFNTFVDYSFGPGSTLMETRDNRFTQARIETILRPYDWLSFRMNTVFDMVDWSFDSNNLDALFRPGRLYFVVSHRYTHTPRVDNVVRDSNNQLTFDAVYSLNNRWSLGSYLRWDASNHVFEEWEIRATRDLHDWLLDFGFNVRNSDRTNAKKELNKEVFFQLRLKALPIVELHAGHRASFAEPRIGQTVSGANDAPLPPWLPTAIDTQQPTSASFAVTS